MEPQREPDRLLAGSRVGAYRIEEKVGAGGMGEVFRATDERLHRTIAVKALSPGLIGDEIARRRILREAKLACRISHPYTAAVYDVVEHGDNVLIAMEYVDGRTFDRVLREDRPALETVLRLSLEMAEALQAIHRAGIVHRDFKPGNVMITNDGHVKVMDFGLARREEVSEIAQDDTTASDDDSLTGTGRAVGTPLYMSPEQMRGEAVDARSDLFSFGVMLYESITGEHPFRRKTPVESVAAILHEPPSGGVEPVSLSGSPSLHGLMLRLLDKDPTQRVPDAGELLVKLREARQEIAPTPGPERARRARFWIVTAVVLAVVAVVALAFQAWIRRPPQWDAPRVTVAVIPFENKTSFDDGELVASMVGELLIADLEGSHIVRVVSPERTSSLTAGVVGAADRRSIVERVVAGSSADLVLFGTLFNEGDRLAARVDFESPHPDETVPPSMRASAASALGLVERLGAGTRRSMPSVSRLAALRDGRGGVEEVAADNAEARRQAQAGRQAKRRGDLTAAIDHYERAVAADPDFALGHANLADVLHLAGYGRRARESAERAMRLAPEPNDRTTERLSLRIRMVHSWAFGRTDELVESTGQLAAQFPDEPESLRFYASALDESGDREAALAVIDRALEIAPEDPWLKLIRAKILMHATRVEESLVWAKRAEEAFRALGSSYWVAEGILTRGRALSMLRRGDEAIAEFQRALTEADPDHGLQAAGIQVEIGRVEMLLGRPEAARERVRAAADALRASGDLRTLSLALSVNGARLYAQGALDAAESDLRESVDLARQLDNDGLLLSPLANLAGLLSHRGVIREARERFAETVPIARRLGRENTEILSQVYLADIDYQLGNIDEAVDSYRQVQQRQTERDLTHISVWSFLGIAEIEERRGRLGIALEQTDRAIEIGRDRLLPDVLGYGLARRARIRSEIGRIDEALQDIGESESIAEEAGRGLQELRARCALARALGHLREGRWQSALEEADRAMGLGASGVPALATAGHRSGCEALMEMRRFDEAVSRCQVGAAIDRAPLAERVATRALLGQVLSRGGQTVEARDVAIEVLEQAKRLDLGLAIARAAATLVPLVGEAGARESALHDGREAVQRFIESAPVGDRDAVRQRADIRELYEILENREKIPGEG